MYRSHFNSQQAPPTRSGSTPRLPGQPRPPNGGFRSPTPASSVFLNQDRNRGRTNTQSILGPINGQSLLYPDRPPVQTSSAGRLPVQLISRVRLPGQPIQQPFGLRSLSAVRPPSKLFTGDKTLYTKPLAVIDHYREIAKNGFQEAAKLSQEAECVGFGHEGEKVYNGKEKFGSFTLFKKLPAELQVRIWGYATEGCEKKDKNGRRILALTVRKECRITTTALTFVRVHRGLLTQPQQQRTAWFERIEVDKRQQGNFVTTVSVFELGVSAACVDSRRCYLKAFPIHMPVRKGVVHFDKETTVYFSGINDPLSGRETLFLPDYYQTCLNQIEKLAFPDRVFQVQLGTSDVLEQDFLFQMISEWFTLELSYAA